MAKTWHQRIYDMLDLSLSRKPNDRDAFLNAIPEMNVVPSSFVYRRCNDRGDYADVCSSTALSYTADLCVDLGLLDGSTARLTSLGKKAREPAAFDGVLVDQIWSVLSSEFGVTRRRLAEVIRRILRAKVSELPTAEKIWSEMGEPGELLRFKRLLRLLARCGGVQVSQKPTYLPIPRRR